MATTGPLTKTIIETIDYLTECVGDVDGPEKDEMIASRTIALVKLIGNLDFEIADATTEVAKWSGKFTGKPSSSVRPKHTSWCQAMAK